MANGSNQLRGQRQDFDSGGRVLAAADGDHADGDADHFEAHAHGDVQPASEAVRPAAHLPEGSEFEPRTISDGVRSVSFDGFMLAQVTSERPHSPRWTELCIYATSRGQYVIHRVGVSCVAHLVTCPNIQSKNLPPAANVGLRDDDDDFAVDLREPCPTCRPDIRRQLEEDPLSLRAETNRNWIGICDTPEGLVNILYTTKDGVRSLNSLSSAALEQASRLDGDVRGVLSSDVHL